MGKIRCLLISVEAHSSEGTYVWYCNVHQNSVAREAIGHKKEVIAYVILLSKHECKIFMCRTMEYFYYQLWKKKLFYAMGNT